MVQTVKDFILYIVLGVGGGSSAAIIFQTEWKKYDFKFNLCYKWNIDFLLQVLL